MLAGARRLAGGAGRMVSKARMPSTRRGKFALGAVARTRWYGSNAWKIIWSKWFTR